MHVGAVRELMLPRHVVHGDGAIGQISDWMTTWGVPTGKVFVVSDPFLIESGSLSGLLGPLNRDGWTVSVFSDVHGEPTVTTTDAAVDAGRRAGADVVIGIGGGSVLDVAKVVALLLSNPGTVDDHIGADLPEVPAAPLVLVPSTTGTGAEATRVAVLSSDHGKRVISNRALVPLATILDAELVVGLPAAITAATGMDALAHAVESCMSTTSTPVTASMSLRAAQLLMFWLPAGYAEPDRIEARRATLYGAFLAGVALNAGVVLGHSMAYTVANRARMSHGDTCAMALPYCLAYNASGLDHDLGSLAEVLTAGESTDLLSAAQRVEALVRSFGIPNTPPEAGVEPSAMPEMVKECATVYHRPSNPVPMTIDRLEGLYAAWFAGDLGSVPAERAS